MTPIDPSSNRSSSAGQIQSRDKLVFCSTSALTIAHSLHDEKIIAPRSLLTALPVNSPSDKELERALGKLRSSIPSEELVPPVHLLFHGSSHHRRTSLRIPHRCSSLPKGRSFVKLGENMFAAIPNLALCELADSTKGFLELLLLLWEACGCYRTELTGSQTAYETEPLTSLASLTRFVTENTRVHGAAKIKRVLRYVRDGSASTRESQIALFMGLPLRYGGFNLGMPLMNHRVNASSEARLIGGRSYFKCDLCWPERKIDVEYQSDESHEGKPMRIRDSRRTNALISMGWTVINITNNEARSLSTLEQISERVRIILRQRAHPSSRELDIKRLRLHRGLGIVDDGLVRCRATSRA